MRCPPALFDELERQKVLGEYGLAPGNLVESLSRVVEIAVSLFDVPVSTVNIVGDDMTFHAAQKGIAAISGPRDISFCAHTIAQDGVMVVEDAVADERFHDNPLVTGGIVRFYAGVPLRAPSGHALGAFCVIDAVPRSDFDERKRQRLQDLAAIVRDELELRRLDLVVRRPARIAALAASSPNAIICFDAGLRITDWSDGAVAMFGYSVSEALGKSVDMLIAPDERSRVSAAMQRVLDGGAASLMGVEMTAVHSNGERFPIEHFWSSWIEGETLHFGAVVQDLIEKHREREALRHLANFDELTGLPNRSLVQHRIRQFLNERRPLGLVVTELGGFSDVNNTLGHLAGEQVLRIAVDRIKAAIPRDSVVGRIGMDQFAVLLVGQDAAAEAETFAGKMHELLSAPILALDPHDEVLIAGFCGVARAPDDASSVEELMGNADLALFQARGLGAGGGVCAFVPALRTAAVARRMYDAELHRAFERQEFRLFYQPQFDLATGQPIGAEALIRWQHPVRGLLAPAAFLPQLEGGALAGRVGTWVLRTACEQVAHWRHERPSFRVSVNLFAAQFRDGGLPNLVAATLAELDLPAQAIELEITENIILDERVNVVPQLRALRERGVVLSFDDFGTGFASLNMLRSCPITDIKIDKSFIQALENSEPDRAIVRSIIGLAHDLKLRVVAEGIETQDSLDFVASLACDKGQGYFFGRPMPPTVFEDRFVRPPRSRRVAN